MRSAPRPPARGSTSSRRRRSTSCARPASGAPPRPSARIPISSGQIAAAEIRGIQRQRVVAQVKHFAANNQEIGRFGNPLGNPPLSPAVDVVVSERALQEIYFPAFKASVQQGGAASVMCSYPRINGMYACENPFLLGTLKDDWGFLGFVGPDAVLAVRDTLAAVERGHRQLPPRRGRRATRGGAAAGVAPAPRRQRPPLLDGDVQRRVFDRPSDGNPDAVVTTPEHRALAAEIAAAGSVLLKNDGDALPLGADVGSIAVIGYDAGPHTQTMEGGSPAVVGGPVVSPLDGDHRTRRCRRAGHLRAGDARRRPAAGRSRKRPHAFDGTRSGSARHVLLDDGPVRFSGRFLRQLDARLRQRARPRAVLGALDRHAHAARHGDVPVLALRQPASRDC